jgi:hypothetical protein
LLFLREAGLVSVLGLQQIGTVFENLIIVERENGVGYIWVFGAPDLKWIPRVLIPREFKPKESRAKVAIHSLSVIVPIQQMVPIGRWMIQIIAKIWRIVFDHILDKPDESLRDILSPQLGFHCEDGKDFLDVEDIALNVALDLGYPIEISKDLLKVPVRSIFPLKAILILRFLQEVRHYGEAKGSGEAGSQDIEYVFHFS